MNEINYVSGDVMTLPLTVECIDPAARDAAIAYDWDFFASEAGNPAWNYQSVLAIYQRIEDWHGVPDPERRGTGGLVSYKQTLTVRRNCQTLLFGVETGGWWWKGKTVVKN